MERCKCKPAKSFAEQKIEYKVFIALVRKMRKAQKEFITLDSCIAYKINKNIKIDTEEYAEHSALMYQMVSLESEVDEWLKKMEV